MYRIYVTQSSDGASHGECLFNETLVKTRSTTGIVGAVCRELMAEGAPDGPWQMSNPPEMVAAPPLDPATMATMSEEEIEDHALGRWTTPTVRMRGPSIYRSAKIVMVELANRGLVEERWKAYHPRPKGNGCMECGEERYVKGRRCIACGGWAPPELGAVGTGGIPLRPDEAAE